MPRLNRRPLKTAVLMCALAIPALAGCEAGLNAPTLEYHPAGPGATGGTNGITISDAFVLGPALNQTLPAGGRAGLFVSIASVNGDRLTSVSAPGAAKSVKITGGSVTVPAAANGVANLTGPAPRIVLTSLSAPLSGGETVTLTFTFANAGDVQLQVPVEPQADDFATFAQPPTPTPSPTASPSSTKKSAKAKASASASSSPSPSATP